MSRPTQSKAQTEANAKILRALVKHTDNKFCADCKKNDPRWASWNIGCFLCIRCSGIHRSMGTHISKVKSIDLDIWTPEQMESIQKWGNRRCNLYWEAHLKSGLIPADHKIESFIRSKYESCRWAKEGPPPSDPAVLDGGATAAAVPDPASGSASNAVSPQPSSRAVAAPPKAPAKAIDLLDNPSPAMVSNTSTSQVPAKPAPQAPKAGGGGGGIFDLDWHEPSSSPRAVKSPTAEGALSGAAKGKNDIMSLFAANSPPAAASPASAQGSAFGSFGSFSGSGLPTTSSGGFGGFNSSLGDLDVPSNGSSTKPVASMASNPWSTSSQPSTTGNIGSSLFDTQDVWGTGNTQPLGKAAPPKNDAFADIWGDFK